MTEVQQTPVSDPKASASGGNEDDKASSAQASRESAPDADRQDAMNELDVLNRTMGRNFHSLEEAKKHYDGLNSLVGDERLAGERKRAKLLENLARNIASENSWSLDAAYAYLENLERQNQALETPGSGSFDPEKAAMEAKISRMERDFFLAQTPEASQVINQLDDFIKASGKGYREAYEYLYAPVAKTAHDFVQAEAQRMEKRQATVTASSSTPPPPERDAYKENMALYQKTGKKEYFREAVKAKWEGNSGLRRAVGVNQ